MSYGRMEEAARKLDEQVEQLLKEAQELDAQEDELYGKGQRGDELPEKMQDEATRAEELRKAQRNFTDPDSRIMPRSGAFQQSYNAQLAVDAKTQLIVAQEVLQTPSDARQMEPMVEQAVANTGLVPKELSADAGYFCQEDIEKVEARGVECFTAPGRLKHGEQPPAAARGRPPARLSRKEQMGRKLRTKRGRKAYARRKVTVEPVIGQLKNRILPRSSVRGLAKVRGEFSLACAAHNLLKLFRQVITLPKRAPALAAQGA